MVVYEGNYLNHFEVLVVKRKPHTHTHTFKELKETQEVGDQIEGRKREKGMGWGWSDTYYPTLIQILL